MDGIRRRIAEQPHKGFAALTREGYSADEFPVRVVGVGA
ncbi:hypothetical protein K353_00154 [Kitasatospora sp. SolWspMP-SS2h]|nr:hypothetical protein K353_00154 [Kitasatospora sp. SolWspMP-SS2h]